MLARTRNSSRDPGEITGYAVALAGDTTRPGDPVWFSGGKLTADLTLPKLRHRWAGMDPVARGPLTAEERAAAWGQALRTVDAASVHVREMAAGAPDSVADTAWAASGTMHAAAALLGSRILRQAADAYDRAARAPWARIPPPTPAGNSLRTAARLLSALAFISGDPVIRPAVLVARLAALAEAVAGMRESQQRAAQAASALSAAQHLQAAAGPATASSSRLAAGTVAGLTGASFPSSPSPVTQAPAAASRPRPAPPAGRPATPRHGP